MQHESLVRSGIMMRSIVLRMIFSENRFPLFGIKRYLIASGLVGEPTAPVIGIAGATNMNS